MNNNINNKTVYYTIINKDKLAFLDIYESIERLETLQSHYVLKCMLNKFGIQESSFSKTKIGKPHFKNRNIFFNYSHSNNYIACAISKFNVGVDIEETDRSINDVMIKICDFTYDNPLEELVKREAYCKLTGEGIAMFFNKNNFKNINKGSMTINTHEYICSICSDCNDPLFQFVDIQ